MKRIRTFLAVCLLSLFAFTNLQGQDLQTATELYNSGAKALSENNYSGAIDSFNKALTMLESLSEEDRGEDGMALLKEAKAIIPQIHLRFGKELATSGSLDNAISQLKIAAQTAKKYSVEGVEEEVKDLIPQLLLVNASNLLNEGKLPEAIAGFKKVIAEQPDNSDAYVRMGVAEVRLNNEAGAIAAFTKAMELGESDMAPKQLSNIFLKRSAAAVRTKNWTEVYNTAIKANEYNVSSTGSKLIGLSSLQLKKYDEAIDALEAYLAAEPAATDKNNIMYNLAVAFEAKGNNAKACGYYKQLLNDPTYKQMAEYKVKTQLKCN